MGTINLDVKAEIAVVTLAAPPMNTLDRSMISMLATCLEDLQVRPAVRAMVLKGKGCKAFSTGSDLREVHDLIHTQEGLRQKLEDDNTVFDRLAAFPKPVIAAVEGLALGGGLELACCCDLIVCASNARLGLPEIQLGAFPGTGGTVRVTQRIGIGRAKQLMMLGRNIDAERALAWGLVDFLAEPGQATTMAETLAQELAAGPLLALRYCKEAISAAYDLPPADAIDVAIDLGARLGRSAELLEGLTAFLQKRKPQFLE